MSACEGIMLHDEEVLQPPKMSPMWKKPDEVMKLHRLKRKKTALQKRMLQPSGQLSLESGNGQRSLDFSSIMKEKRKNPFSKSKQTDKRFKESSILDESNDSTLFQLIALTSSKTTDDTAAAGEKLSSFTNLLQKYSKEHEAETESVIVNDSERKVLPVDWTLKTKLRFMSPKPFAWNQKLKASEEASGITGFVRCLDTTSPTTTLDTSHHAMFHQHCLYWQHPNLPWMSLFPRNIGKAASKNFIASNDELKDSLHKEWIDSFRSLFQLVRARQCPYFYVCANTFTCLFRAAGICGMTETTALVTPTTRGLRHTLKQEEIEFTMPLKKCPIARNGDEKDVKNSSSDSCYESLDSSPKDEQQVEQIDEHSDEDDDDLESDQWLKKIGMEASEIKKINYSQVRINQKSDSAIDNARESLIAVQGIDAQALFNFLLNCKSSIATTGPFGGIPPTLIAPVAFQGGTLKPLKVRESVINSDGGKYYSVEIRGPLIPTAVNSLCSLLHSNGNPFSVTFANLQSTVPLSEAAKTLLEDEKPKENKSGTAPNVFGRENLSDCGLNSRQLQHFCTSDTRIIKTIDSLGFDAENKTYTY